MSFVAILGAGPIGAATAHSLARQARIGKVLFVDAAVNVAAGKALDMQQSGAIENFDTRLSATDDPLSAIGAAVIVVADSVGSGDWTGREGEAMVKQLTRAGTQAPFVFAGPSQTELMEGCFHRLKLPAGRLIGTAPSALVGTIRSFAGLELNLSSVELTVVGRPPAFVIGWSAATVSGSLVTDRVPAHRLLAMSQSLPKLWPPGPQAIGAATAEVVGALIFGSRRRHPALTILQDDLGAEGAAVLLPLELGRLRVLSHLVPSLSPQERTAVVSGLKPGA